MYDLLVKRKKNKKAPAKKKKKKKKKKTQFKETHFFYWFQIALYTIIAEDYIGCNCCCVGRCSGTRNLVLSFCHGKTCEFALNFQIAHDANTATKKINTSHSFDNLTTRLSIDL
jgi:hypothetical protein